CGGVAGAGSLADRSAGRVAHAHRHAAAGGDDDRAELLDIFEASAGAHHDAFAVALDVAGAAADIVGFNGLGDIGEGQAERDQFRRFGIDLVLFEVAADRVHAGDARHHLDLRPDDPVLHSAQIGVLLNVAIEPLSVLREKAAVALQAGHAVALDDLVRKMHGPHGDFAKAGRNRTDAGLDALRQAGTNVV